MTEPTKTVLDGVSLAVVGSTLASALPPLAAGLSAVWCCLRIYETKTVQKWLGR